MTNETKKLMMEAQRASMMLVGEQPERMTSQEIAQLTGKAHNDVMKAIRRMEPAWEKIRGGKFSLTQRVTKLPTGGERLDPMYSLTKTECLYVATKFNDEARARLVLRWEELERESRCRALTAERTALRVLLPRAHYCDEVLLSSDCLSTTRLAKELGMTVYDLTRLLLSHGIIYFHGGDYLLYGDFARQGYARSRTDAYRGRDGVVHTNVRLVWTERGRRFVHSVVEELTELRFKN